MQSREAYLVVLLTFLVACAAAQAEDQGANPVLLAPGKSVTLVDPANPGMQVLITAPVDKSLDLSELIAAVEKGGAFSAVLGSQIRPAGSVVMNPDGSMSLRAAPPALANAPGAAPVSSKGVTIQGGIVVVNPGNTVIHTDRAVHVSPASIAGPVPVGTPVLPSIPASTATAMVPKQMIITGPVSASLPNSAAITPSGAIPLQTFNTGSGNIVPITLTTGGVVLNTGGITLNSITGVVGTISTNANPSVPATTVVTGGIRPGAGAVTTMGIKTPAPPVITVR